MRVPVCLVLAGAVALGGFEMAADNSTGTSFEELLTRVKKDFDTPAGPAYHHSVAQVYASKLSKRLVNCLVGEVPPEEVFKAVLIISADGKVSDVVVNPETRMSKCVRSQFRKGKFPEPPFAPFHDMIEMNFQVKK